MSEITSCPNCGAKIKDGIFGSNFMLTEIKCQLIADVTNTPKIAGCSKCLSDTFDKALASFLDMRSKLQAEIVEHLKDIPIITSHSPYGWEYNVIGLATGQSTTGTGLFTEAAASWTDFFGMQSAAYNKKIAKGEDICLQQLRSKAVKLGGNAVVAVDIDYSELGGDKGMVMVCMSGTVVRINNLDVLERYRVDSINKIKFLIDKLSSWNDKYAEFVDKT